MLALTELLLLVASINFQLNLGYALTFLLAGSALASLGMGHRNLRAIELSLGRLEPVFLGQSAILPVQLQAATPRYAVSLALRDSRPLAWSTADLPTEALELRWLPAARGLQPLPRLVLESRYPLGIARLWSYWQPAGQQLVYPQPETPCPPMPTAPASAAGEAAPHAVGGQSLEDLRAYRRGDSLRTIVWKKAAQTLASGQGELIVRSGAARASQSRWLDAAATGLGDTEAQIARLTAWVLQAAEHDWRWGLRLPSGHCLPPAAGPAHLQACLRALAVDGLN